MRKKTWKIAAGVSLALVSMPAFGSFASLAPVSVAYAAEASEPAITQEKAIELAKKWVVIPSDYKQNRASFREAKPPYNEQPTWRITWENQKEDAGVFVTIDAATGELIQFNRFADKTQSADGSKAILEEEALGKATQFLNRVTSEAERKKLSKPNEYAPLQPYYYSELSTKYVFMFTRIENGLPFLENGFQLVVDQSGEVISYTKEWSKGDLPDPRKVISAEDAKSLAAEKAAPSLVYKELSEITGNYERDSSKYALVYDYGKDDPQYVEAISGTLIDAQGKEAKQKSIQALGTTVAKQDKSKKRVTKEDAQQIAEQLIKKLPGAHRSEGSNGGGSSSGPDGIRIQSWDFEFTPVQSKDKKADTVELSINDRGELEAVSLKEGARFRETGQKVEKAVSWKEAEESAIQLVKTFYADRLGEIFLLDPPSEASLRDVLERGRQYEVQFGWLKDGIPVENGSVFVQVNPQTGIAEGMDVQFNDISDISTESGKKVIDPAAAKQVEQEQKTWVLTYYQPQFDYRDVSKKVKPMLIYRYVGDKGLVDARTGKWISFEQERKKQDPQDIAGHPQQAALEYAIRMGFMTVEDGKLEPDKQVTRGEMLQLLSRLTNRVEFRTTRRSLSDDEEAERFEFADVDRNHPQYAVIQKAIQYGIIAKEGTRFEPEKAVTRAEAAEMIARLLGYGDLLDKPGIFVSAYSDVQPKDNSAVTIVRALGLMPGKTGAAFQPNASLTRAEAAQLLQEILKLKRE